MYDQKVWNFLFLQLLDGKAAPAENKKAASAENRLEQKKRERLALAAVKKKKFKDDLSARLLHLNTNNCYCTSNDILGNSKMTRK